MLASRLVKSCLFVLVALAPIAAKGSFVVDDFGNTSLSSTIVGDGTTRTIGGINRTVTQTIPGTVNVNFTGLGTAVFTYTAGLGSNFGTLSGNAALNTLFFDFVAPPSTANVIVNVGGTEVFSGSLTGSQSLQIDAAGLAAANLLTITLQGFNSTVRLTELTATPEPTTMLMFGAVAGVGYVVRRRRAVKASKA